MYVLCIPPTSPSRLPRLGPCTCGLELCLFPYFTSDIIVFLFPLKFLFSEKGFHKTLRKGNEVECITSWSLSRSPPGTVVFEEMNSKLVGLLQVEKFALAPETSEEREAVTQDGVS